jgi:hypothetical protein
MKWLTLFTSLLLATCAAYFSIVGIMTIFAGAAFAVMIMATVLEIGKLVSTAWLHYEWDRINNLVRAYFIFAVLVLMFITSMGIFGYLSKAHIDQTIQVGGNNELKIEMLERKIQRQQDIINDSEKVVAQLDDTVEKLQEYDRIRGPDGAIAIRSSQAEERLALNETIETSYNVIEDLQVELLPLKKEQISLEAEIGPLKYIAELVYGEENARDNFDNAVRWIIILLVFVFDPLAIMLLIVSTGAFKRDKLKIKPLIDEDQIMRMYIDENKSSNSFSDNTGESATANTGKTVRKENSDNATQDRRAADDELYLQQQRSIREDDSKNRETGPSDVTEDNGNLKTTLRRRPI